MVGKCPPLHNFVCMLAEMVFLCFTHSSLPLFLSFVLQQEHWFEKALTEKKGFVIKKMKEDGACLFRAVGGCLCNFFFEHVITFRCWVHSLHEKWSKIGAPRLIASLGSSFFLGSRTRVKVCLQPDHSLDGIYDIKFEHSFGFIEVK